MKMRKGFQSLSHVVANQRLDNCENPSSYELKARNEAEILYKTVTNYHSITYIKTVTLSSVSGMKVVLS